MSSKWAVLKGSWASYALQVGYTPTIVGRRKSLIMTADWTREKSKFEIDFKKNDQCSEDCRIM